jgi:hypothetical protein
MIEHRRVRVYAVNLARDLLISAQPCGVCEPQPMSRTRPRSPGSANIHFFIAIQLLARFSCRKRKLPSRNVRHWTFRVVPDGIACGGNVEFMSDKDIVARAP